MLSQNALTDFKKIWQDEYGETISDNVAVDNAHNFLTFFDKIYRPMKQVWLKDFEKSMYTSSVVLSP